MIRKDYELLAKALRGAPSGVVERVADALADDNVRFNRGRFVEACQTSDNSRRRGAEPLVVDCEIFTHLGDAIVHPVSARAREFFHRLPFVSRSTLPPDHYPFFSNPCVGGKGVIAKESFTFVEMGEIEGEE